MVEECIEVVLLGGTCRLACMKVVVVACRRSEGDIRFHSCLELEDILGDILVGTQWRRQLVARHVNMPVLRTLVARRMTVARHIQVLHVAVGRPRYSAQVKHPSCTRTSHSRKQGLASQQRNWVLGHRRNETWEKLACSLKLRVVVATGTAACVFNAFREMKPLRRLVACSPNCILERSREGETRFVLRQHNTHKISQTTKSHLWILPPSRISELQRPQYFVCRQNTQQNVEAIFRVCRNYMWFRGYIW